MLIRQLLETLKAPSELSAARSSLRKSRLAKLSTSKQPGRAAAIATRADSTASALDRALAHLKYRKVNPKAKAPPSRGEPAASRPLKMKKSTQ